MKRYVIEITDANVYINGELCEYDFDMDVSDQTTDLDEKALLSLADKMGYEATPLFEEMVDRLYEMLDEVEYD